MNILQAIKHKIMCTMDDHQWGNWLYRSENACDQERECKRCKAKQFRKEHKLSEIKSYRYNTYSTYAIKVEEFNCTRCGYELVNKTELDILPCEECNGTGEVDCYHCRGAIQIETESGKLRWCEYCSRTGKTTCSCGGTGYIEVKKA